jgi:hypothetical protein
VPESIISREWIAEQAEIYGEDSPQYFVRVLGKFPPKGGDYQLIPEVGVDGAAESVAGRERRGVQLLDRALRVGPFLERQDRRGRDRKEQLGRLLHPPRIAHRRERAAPHPGAGRPGRVVGARGPSC